MAELPKPHGYIHCKDDYLRRIEGQSRGLQRMVKEEYCIDILTQVSAMTRTLQSVAWVCSMNT